MSWDIAYLVGASCESATAEWVGPPSPVNPRRKKITKSCLAWESIRPPVPGGQSYPIMNGLTADHARAAYDTSSRALLSNFTEHYHYISPYLPGCPAVVPVASAGLKRFSWMRSSAGSM